MGSPRAVLGTTAVFDLIDLPEENESYQIMFADDANFMNEIQSNRECNMLQRDPHRMQYCLDKLLIKLSLN